MTFIKFKMATGEIVRVNTMQVAIIRPTNNPDTTILVIDGTQFQVMGKIDEVEKRLVRNIELSDKELQK